MRKATLNILLATSLLAALAPSASAKDQSYLISISWTSGPLTGIKSRGYVSFNDALAVPNAEYTDPNLLDRFSFILPDVSYSLSDVTTGFLTFDSTGALRLLAFGTDCGPGYCASDPGDPNSIYFVYDSQSQLDRFFAVQGPPEIAQQSYGAGALRLIGRGSGVGPTAPIPEPSTLALWALGLAGITAQRRRRA